MAVLVTGLLSTAIVVAQLQKAANERDRQRFRNVIDRLEDAINQRMEGYYALLRATAGLVGGDGGETSVHEFDGFIERMKLKDYYKGAVGIGFSRRVAPGDLKSFEDHIRRTLHPSFKVAPDAPRGEAQAIVLLSPQDQQNRRAIGFDMASDPVRRQAMDRARDSGTAAATGRVTLIQNEADDPTPGFLVYVPVFEGPADPVDIGQRRAALLGFAYAPFRAGELFYNIVPPGAKADAAFKIYDSSTPNEQALLYHNEPEGHHEEAAAIESSHRMLVAGRTWLITAQSTPAFNASRPAGLAAPAAIAGIILSVLMTLLTRLQTRARLAAEVDRRAADDAREEARTAAERLELVLKGARVGLWYSTLPFETLQWDDRVKAHFFLPPEEKQITVEGAFERVHPDDRERIRAAMGWSIRDGAPFDVEYRTVSPDGTRMNWIRSIGQTFIDADGEASRFDVLTIDVTALKQGQESLAESEAKFRQLANSIPQLAWIARPDGWIFWYNQRWYDYTGTTPALMEGWGWKSVQDPEYLPLIMETWQRAIATGEPAELEFPIRAASGTFGWFLTRVVPLRDAAGNVLFWFGTNTDLSEQRKLSNERERLLESERAARGMAERASRMKDEFLATLSHELRTPLNAILGWSQILRRQHAGNADLVDGLSVIERNARVQTQLVSDLLDMSRVISGKLRLEVQVIDPSTVVHAAVESVRPAADAKEITLVPDFDPQAGPVYGDPSRLQQVIWNLLSNAIKFTPKGGQVQLSLARVDDKVVFGVADSGEGIEPDFLPFLFERFRQADGSITRRHGGLGLGLAIVKNLVELHGGKVWATSAGPGQGAHFYVELPILVGTPVSLDNSPGEPDHAAANDYATMYNGDSLKGVRVLLVDDEPDARDLISRVLAESGATVFVASGGPEAMKILERDRPDVILSDIGMPGQDGYEFIRAVRQLSPADGGAIPAAALTAFARTEDRRRALIAGYQNHIAKPFESAELITVVAALAGRMNQPAEVLN
ncbi:CHASE domain-containing protein [Humisphaera borealis]|uniref:histidine kinase n=1 Tax=Humisphaera borealis TaxID=2807512 RepID=A0A7M2WW25_9BACT|nr:CHASE domain-containing protein [Humisphaera borealis]QOV89666.1 CHASE domain-containing protein [Humisphaera borealis]